MKTLTDAVVGFCERLRDEYGFALGTGECRDALRALDAIGITQRARAQAALRLVCCASHDEVLVFDQVFAEHFLAARQGVLQEDYAPRHSRRRDDRAGESRDEGGTPRPLEPDPEPQPDDASWEAMLAKYSAIAARRDPPAIPREGLAAMLAAAARFVARMRAGRSRRWRPMAKGHRIDVRRTLRASLQTGGEPQHLRKLGHPLRNPKFVVLIDGSRSMAEYGAQALQFAYALRRRAQRARVFVFSTQLREITRELSQPMGSDDLVLPHLGEAWGGGTRIGASLRAFVRAAGARVDEHTIAFIISDGLDVGDVGDLRAALRTLSRRASLTIWLNPLLAVPGYEPVTRGMHVALQQVDVAAPLNGSRTFDALRG